MQRYLFNLLLEELSGLSIDELFELSISAPIVPTDSTIGWQSRVDVFTESKNQISVFYESKNQVHFVESNNQIDVFC